LKKFILGLAVVGFVLSGCSASSEAEKGNYIIAKEEPSILVDMGEVKADDEAGAINEINEINEYALYVKDDYFPVNTNYILTTILENTQAEEFPADFPYPTHKRYSGHDLSISTFVVDDERGQGEVIYNILAKKDAKTPRGVGIGNNLSELQTAYNDLKYEANWLPEDNEPNFNRVYIYAPEDSRTYIAFFLYEKEIVMIEVADGFDHMPGIDINEKEILGITGVIKETSNMSGKGANYKYIYMNEAGEEEILIDLYARSFYEVDLDNDGITELIVYLQGNMQSIRIYDVVEDEFSYIDVDEKLGSYWSSGLESMGNLKREYKNYILAGFQNDDGTTRREVYKAVNNELIYVGPFSDEMLM